MARYRRRRRRVSCAKADELEKNKNNNQKIIIIVQNITVFNAQYDNIIRRVNIQKYRYGGMLIVPTVQTTGYIPGSQTVVRRTLLDGGP